MKRTLPDWLSTYLQFVENTEPPLQFHNWTAVSIIAGTLQRRTRIEWQSTIYPNCFVFLVGSSGATRKGTALANAQWFLDRAKIRLVASNSITKERLVQVIKENMSSFSDPPAGRRFQCATTHIIPELSTFLGMKNIELLSWLTDWYDSLPSWKYSTKNMGTDEVVNMSYNMLAATAPDWMDSMLPMEAMGGGFTSRCIFVYETAKEKIVANPRMTEEEKKLREDLLSDLLQIRRLSGEFKISPEAEELYTEWYEKQENDRIDGLFPIHDRRFSGYIARRQTHCFKLCMVMSASRGNDMVITGNDFQRAKILLESTELKMPHAFGGFGRARYGRPVFAVSEYLRERGEARYSELLRIFSEDIDKYTMDIVLDNLREQQVVSRRKDALDWVISYLSPKAPDSED